MITPVDLFPRLESWDPTPLRKALLHGGFQCESLESLGLPERWMRSIIPRAALLGHVQENSSLEGLIRLFTLGDTLPGDLALRSLGDSIHGLIDLGFLAVGGGGVRSKFQLVPIRDGWIASDFHKRQGEDATDYVMGIGPSSQLLASLTPPVGGRVLELASGVGWLAGRLAKAGRHVVATDLNPRALSLGRFSVRLSGIDGIDFRLSDGFAALAGETFDLIVSNPPYVQSPGGNMTFKEAPAGDPICARLLRQIPEHLAPGGIAVILIHWIHASEDDWEELPLSWVTPVGTRRWLFQSDCSSPADYAWTWISNDLRFKDEHAALDEIRRWLAHYQSHGIKHISGGFMVIQKCDPGGEWTRTEKRSAENIGSQSGQDVLRVLANESWLTGNPDLLTTRFTVPDAVGSDVHMKLGTTGWERETIRLTSPQRLSYDGQIDENLLRLLAIIRAGGTASDMVAEIGSKPEFAAIGDLPERITGLVRELVSHGILIPS